MYIPEDFRIDDNREAIDFMKRYSFATIITSDEGIPVASHLPFVVEELASGLWLTAHFAKANEHWRLLGGKKSLVVFSEPHAYVSPRYYDAVDSVPTWNYLAVHVYGYADIINDTDETLKLLEALIDSSEPEYRSQWDSLPMEYKLKMMSGIVAFRMKVTDLQAKKKLSQNKNVEERQRIIAVFEASSHENEKAIAAYMRQGKT